MAGERTVEIVQLLAAGRGHSDRHAQIFASTAGAQLHSAGVKVRVKFFGYLGDGMHEIFSMQAHDLDREQTGIFNQRFLARIGASGGVGHGRSGEKSKGFCLDR